MFHRNRVLSAANAILYTALSVTLIFFTPIITRQSHAFAQSPNNRDTSRADLEARQRALRNLDKLKQRLSRRPPEPHLAYQQIKEDFEQLQLVNYHLSGANDAGTSTLNYGQISKDAAEVRKRASRLKTNLLLPEPEKDEKLQKSKDEYAVAELNPAIVALNGLVNSFVWNPVFQHPNVLDVEQSVKARRDLEGIIRLSEQIHKQAEALDKATGKNH